MDKNLHDIDKLFTEGIEGYEEMPSPGVWEGIDHTLDKHGLDVIKKKYKNLKLYSVIAITGLIALLVYKSQFLTKKLQSSNADPLTEQVNYDSTGVKPAFEANAIIPALPSKKDGNTVTYQGVTGENNIPNNGSFEKNDGTDLDENNKAPNEIQNSNLTNNKVSNNETISKPGQFNQPANNTYINPKTVVNNNSSIQETDKKTKLLKPVKESNNNDVYTVTTNENLYKASGKNNSPLKTAKDLTNDKALNVATNNNLPLQQKDQLPESQTTETNTEAAYVPRQTQSLTAVHKSIVYNNSAIHNFIQSNIGLKQIESPSLAKSTGRRSTAVLKPQISLLPYGGYASIKRTIENNPKTPTVGMRPRRDDDWEKVKQYETSAIQTYETGVKAEFLFLNKLSIVTGMGLSSQYNKIAPKPVETELGRDGTIRFRFDYGAGSAYIKSKPGNVPLIGDSAISAASTSRLRYMQVPLTAGFYIQKNKFSITPFVGATANILLDKQLSTELTYAGVKEAATVKDIEGLKSMYYTANEGIMIEYRASRRFTIVLAPNISQALTAINKNAVVKSYPNSVGIQAGLKINLK